VDALELLKKGAESGFSELLSSLEGVTEGQAWAVLPPHGSDYLHTDGSIQGIVLHVASVKWGYGSICFRGTSLRWRDIAVQMDAFEPSWAGAVDYLRRGHEYWMESWASLRDLEALVPTNYKKEWEAWRIIQMMSQHDSYHAGQIAVLRYGVGKSDVPPASYAADIRGSCTESVHW